LLGIVRSHTIIFRHTEPETIKAELRIWLNIKTKSQPFIYGVKRNTIITQKYKVWLFCVFTAEQYWIKVYVHSVLTLMIDFGFFFWGWSSFLSSLTAFCSFSPIDILSSFSLRYWYPSGVIIFLSYCCFSVSVFDSASGITPRHNGVYHRGHKSDLLRFRAVSLLSLVRMGLQVAYGI